MTHEIAREKERDREEKKQSKLIPPPQILTLIDR